MVDRPLTFSDIVGNPRRWWPVFIIALLVLFPVWSIFDREAPYTRMKGTIRPPNPEPGGIIEVEWEIKTNRSCTPAADNNLSRRIIDANKVVWGYSQIPTYFGNEFPTSRNDTTNKIVRSFKLPQGIARGPATYLSSASFVCDLLHMQRMWPIVVTDEGIKFYIGAFEQNNSPR